MRRVRPAHRRAGMAAGNLTGSPGDTRLSEDRDKRAPGDGTAPIRRQGELFAGHGRSFHLPRPGDDRIGVVDVGSNSVRMVVFEDGRRCPAMVFNEKILCGLGAQLAKTGRLDPDGKVRALRALKRFVALAPGLHVGALAGVATAAIREAEDGPEFRDEIEYETGIRLSIASGADEARLAAQGVLFGDPDASGLVVDLGGASMELCPVGRGKAGAGVTTPLGPQRLGSVTGREDAIRREIDGVLGREAIRFQRPVERLYLVGGAWRALGRIQIRESGHPMSVLHEHVFTIDDALKLSKFVLGQDAEALREVPGLSSGRVATLPHAALLLERLSRHFEPEHGFALSGFGLREGVCYAYLPPQIRTQDPLISTCAGMERTRARASGFGAELADWLLAVFGAEDAAEERLIRAACHLVDVNWRSHPDRRAKSSMELVTRVNVSSVGHAGRAFIGGCLLNRYKSGRKAMANEPVMTLVPERKQEHAVQIGALMRLGCTISGAVPGYLPLCPLSVEQECLTMRPAPEAEVFMGEEVEKRLGQAARALGLESQIA